MSQAINNLSIISSLAALITWGLNFFCKKYTMAVLNDIYIDEYTRTVVRNLLKKTTFSIEEIADLTEVSVDFVKDVKKKIRNRKK